MHVELLQGANRLGDRGQDRDPDVLDEDVLAGGGASLHSVEDDHVGSGLDGQSDVEVGAGRPDLDVDRLAPVGDLPELADLDLEVVGTGPIRMPAGAPLIDPHRQIAHLGDAVGDLLAHQYSPGARLRSLVEYDIDRGCTEQVVLVHAVWGG